MSTPQRRRWFQVSLAELVILTTLLGVAWWQCIKWPVADTATTTVMQQIPGPVAPVAPGQWRMAYVRPVTSTIDIERPSTPREVAVRGAIATAVIVGIWLVASGAVRVVAWRRGRTVPNYRTVPN